MASDLLFPTDQSEEKSYGNSQEELFVFGYSCKLFRDDEEAKLVDKGKYMIPWMGDERLKIDRYDGRGHLYDLSAYDADLNKTRNELTEDEKQIEKLCDEERYLELHTDVVEKAMYEEEEWKRYYESLSEGYKAVGFSYDYNGQENYQMEEQGIDVNEDEKPYVPPEELQLPPDIQIPATIKENAIIEKTAKFIAEHGTQMEIMMKTKQSNNSQFLFMYFENELHQYYKHMVKMIKSKKYIPKSPDKDQGDDLNDSGELDDDQHGYLHPTLLTANRASPTPEVHKPLTIQMPKVSIHETPYGQLLQSFSKVNKEVADKNRAKELREMKTEPSSLTDSLAPAYGPSMPPPPGLEPVTLPKLEPEDMDVKQETDSSESQQIVPPPPDAQPIVDRMAMYVAKNGEEFEIVVKSKNDTRFQFLETWHMHYSYYNFKKHLFLQEMEREKKEKEEEERRKEQEKADMLAKGVKFKLKKAKEQESTTLEKKKVFDNDESTDEELMDQTDLVKESKGRSSQSGTSTPLTDTDTTEGKHEEQLEKKIAEQKVRDRLAASAREKLSQSDKDKQKKEERKRKAAMFLSLLKNKSGDDESDTKQTTPSDSGRNTPVKVEEKTSSTSRRPRDRSRSKDRVSRSQDKRSRSRSRDKRSRSRDKRSRSRDKRSRSQDKMSRSRDKRSRSQDKISRSRDKRSRSRDRRSKSREESRSSSRRSRSSSRSKSKKKKRKRSATPPSAYAIVRRSPPRYAPPPPPRYIDIRGRYSRSPSNSYRHRTRSRSPVSKGSRHRSRSRSKSKSKSKKKKRSKSPKAKHEESSSSHKKKSSKKKKKKSKSQSPKHKRSKISPIPESPVVGADKSGEENHTGQDGKVMSPVGDLDGVVMILDDEVEEGEMREEENKPPAASSTEETPVSNSKSESPSPELRRPDGSMSSSDSPNTSPSPTKQPVSRSRSPSPPSKNSPVESGEITPVGVNGDSNSGAGDPGSTAQKNVSSYMINRVRALIQASKAAVKEEEDMFADP